MRKSKEVVLNNKSTDLVLPEEAYNLVVSNEGTYVSPVKQSYIEKLRDKAEKSLTSTFILFLPFTLVSPPLLAEVIGVPPIVTMLSFVGMMIANIVGPFSLVAPLVKKKNDKKIKQINNMVSSSLIEWMKKEYDLLITDETAYGLTRYFLESRTTEGYDYPFFSDTKGFRYKLIDDPRKGDGSKVVVSADYEVKLDEEFRLAEERLLEELPSATASIANTVEYNFTKSQKSIYEIITKNLSALAQCDLSTEDKYSLSRIQAELSNTLKLHKAALAISSEKYDAKKLDILLSQFSDELQHLADKQISHINQQLELQESLNTTR
jgi:hypothetical protein